MIGKYVIKNKNGDYFKEWIDHDRNYFDRTGLVSAAARFKELETTSEAARRLNWLVKKMLILEESWAVYQIEERLMENDV